jgi:hypothetical protein
MLNLGDAIATTFKPVAGQPVLRQIGWLGVSGRVYSMTEPAMHRAEPGGIIPLYIQIGTWEMVGDTLTIRD